MVQTQFTALYHNLPIKEWTNFSSLKGIFQYKNFIYLLFDLFLQKYIVQYPFEGIKIPT